MSYKEKKITTEELYELRLKYLHIFTEFNEQHQFLLPFINVMHNSFYGGSKWRFLSDTPHGIDAEKLYKKLKVVSVALKDFLETIESE